MTEVWYSDAAETIRNTDSLDYHYRCDLQYWWVQADIKIKSYRQALGIYSTNILQTTEKSYLSLATILRTNACERLCVNTESGEELLNSLMTALCSKCISNFTLVLLFNASNLLFSQKESFRQASLS